MAVRLYRAVQGRAGNLPASYPCALTIALEATKLAIEAANDAPRRTSHAQPTVPQIFESWHAANLLVHEVFENLYAQARYAIGVIKPMVTLD